jgi:hypothetical protein
MLRSPGVNYADGALGAKFLVTIIPFNHRLAPRAYFMGAFTGYAGDDATAAGAAAK